jgi:hypothetical protein
MTSIFSTYSIGENRVKASILAVLRSLSLSRIERLLGAMLEQSEFELVKFQNQPSKGATGIPDTAILSSIRLLIEAKTVRDAVCKPQIERHLERLDDAFETMKVLLVLTPDDERPKVLAEFNDQRMDWASFSTLDQAIDEMLGDPHEVVSEREAFLLRELQSILEAEGLLANPLGTVIVAARNAWPEYNEFHAYVCQPNRGFRQVAHMGFYSKGFIYPLIPKIVEVQDDVVMEKNLHKGRLGELVNFLLERSLRLVNQRYKVFLLSAPDSSDTIKLAEAIPNDKRDKSGKSTAFTMGQRYVAISDLLSAKSTSELDAD